MFAQKKLLGGREIKARIVTLDLDEISIIHTLHNSSSSEAPHCQHQPLSGTSGLALYRMRRESSNSSSFVAAVTCLGTGG